MADAKWSGVLSTTEPRNDVGIIKVRQGNLNSEIAEFQIVQNNKPYDLTGLTVYFCANFGFNLVEKSSTVINEKAGKIQYTFDDDSMQAVGRQKGYFSIKKEGSKIDSTQEFEYQVESSLMTRSIDGKSYIYRLSTLIELLDDFVKNGQEDFDAWFESVKEILYGVDPGGNILRELIESRTTETGQVYDSLKARLNDFESKTTAQLQQTEQSLNAQLAQTEQSLNAQLAQTEQSLDTRLQENRYDILTIDERVDNIISNPGDGTVPTELLDIRVGDGGVNYNTAGDHVRTLDKAVGMVSAKNEIENGDFSSGIAPWEVYYGNASVFENTLTAVGDGTSKRILIRQIDTKIPTNTAQKIYIGFDYQVSAPSIVAVRIFGYRGGTVAQFAIAANPSPNKSRYSTVITTDGDGVDDTVIEFVSIYENDSEQNGKQFKLENVMAINLTETFGSGGEPTAEQVQGYLSKYKNRYFSGVNVLKTIADEVKNALSPNEGILTVSKNGIYPTLASAFREAEKRGSKTTVQVMPGEYEEVFKPLSSGLVNLVFIDKENTKLIDKSGEYDNSPLYAQGDFYGKNLHVVANSESNPTPPKPYSYAYHHEGDGAGTVIFENSVFESELSSAVGIGMRQSQKVVFRNCTFVTRSTSHAAAYIHNSQRSNVSNQQIEFWNCVFINEVGEFALRVDDSNILFGNGDGTSVMSVLFVNSYLYSKTHGTDCVWIHEPPLGAGKLSGNIDLDPRSYGNNISLLNAYQLDK